MQNTYLFYAVIVCLLPGLNELQINFKISYFNNGFHYICTDMHAFI